MLNLSDVYVDGKKTDVGSAYRLHSIIKEIYTGNCYTKKRAIKENDVVVDIGANVGLFSLFAAFSGAQVFSFEPNPNTFSDLEKNVELYGLQDKIHVYNYAVTDLDGEVDLIVPETKVLYSPACASTSEIFIKNISDTLDFKPTVFKVKTISIRTLANLVQDKIDFLKMDCEGSEYVILKGLTDESISYISMETHRCYRDKEMASLLNEKGFLIECYEREQAVLINTGYCYAVKSGLAKDINKTPVALFDVPSYVSLTERFSVDASHSFSLNEEVASHFLWCVDGKDIVEKTPFLDCSFSVPGVHQIGCQMETVYGNSTLKKHCIVLDCGIESKDILFMDTSGICYPFQIKKKLFVGVRKKFIPFARCVALIIRAELEGLFISYAGKRVPVERHQTELKIEYQNIDLLFSVESEKEISGNILWYIYY